MADVNKVILIGRTIHEIDERSIGYTTGGTARLNISIAVNRREKRNGEWADRVSYFDVTIWGKTAENIKQYLTKGKQIAVEGYLDQQRWEKDGQKYSKVCIIADNVQLLGRKNEGAPQQAQGYNDAGSGDDFPEDLPF